MLLIRAHATKAALLSEIPSAIWLLLFEGSKLVASHTPPNREHALPSIALIMMSRKPNVRAVNMLKGRLVPKQTQSALLHYLSASKLPKMGNLVREVPKMGS